MINKIELNASKKIEQKKLKDRDKLKFKISLRNSKMIYKNMKFNYKIKIRNKKKSKNLNLLKVVMILRIIESRKNYMNKNKNKATLIQLE